MSESQSLESFCGDRIFILADRTMSAWESCILGITITKVAQTKTDNMQEVITRMTNKLQKTPDIRWSISDQEKFEST